MLLLAWLAGCGDDDSSVAAPSPSASSDSESGSSPTDEPTAEATKSEVAPATGPVIRKSVATVRVPEKWVTRGSQLFTDAEREPRNEALLEKEVFGFIDLDLYESEGALTLDEAAREVSISTDIEGKRVEDGELGGEPAFVFTKSLDAFGSTEYTIGLARGPRLVVLDFSLLGGDERQREAVIESVLATWEWQQ